MAKSSSLLRLTGKIGGMVFFERYGETIVRENNPITKAQIMSQDNFRRVRENMQEFEGSTAAAKTMLDSFRKVLKRIGNKNSYPSLVALFRSVIALGTGVRGQLTMEIVPNRLRFLGFGFNTGQNFGSVYQGTYTLAGNANRNSATLTLPGFDPLDELRYPTGATHFRIACGISSLSDMQYDIVLKRYVPVQPTLDALKDIAWTAE